MVSNAGHKKQGTQRLAQNQCGQRRQPAKLFAGRPNSFPLSFPAITKEKNRVRVQYNCLANSELIHTCAMIMARGGLPGNWQRRVAIYVESEQRGVELVDPRSGAGSLLLRSA